MNAHDFEVCHSSCQWLSKAKSTTPDMTAVWEQMNSLKDRVILLLDSENDGYVPCVYSAHMVGMMGVG